MKHYSFSIIVTNARQSFFKDALIVSLKDVEAVKNIKVICQEKCDS